jgi:hypothetical protein
MSVSEPDQGAPILPGSALARRLDDFAVPGLSAGFADRVLSAAEARPPATLAPLPQLRRAPRSGRGWRLGRGIAIGVASFGLLATAAAATGLLQQFDIPVPSAGKVWASITGAASAAPPVAVTAAAVAKPVPSEAAAQTPVEIVGPVDTPEELAEAFRRIDEVRQGRLNARSERIDQRIESAIERRRAAGLPPPTAEEEAAFRTRIEAERARREQIADERIAARRAEMQRKVESGEALTREDILRPLREDRQALQRQERLRQLQAMSPEQRREALRRLPPQQRRALIEEYRARRAGGAGAQPTPGAPPAPDPVPAPAE